MLILTTYFSLLFEIITPNCVENASVYYGRLIYPYYVNNFLRKTNIFDAMFFVRSSVRYKAQKSSSL